MSSADSIGSSAKSRTLLVEVSESLKQQAQKFISSFDTIQNESAYYQVSYAPHLEFRSPEERQHAEHALRLVEFARSGTFPEGSDPVSDITAIRRQITEVNGKNPLPDDAVKLVRGTISELETLLTDFDRALSTFLEAVKCRPLKCSVALDALKQMDEKANASRIRAGELLSSTAANIPIFRDGQWKFQAVASPQTYHEADATGITLPFFVVFPAAWASLLRQISSMNIPGRPIAINEIDPAFAALWLDSMRNLNRISILDDELDPDAGSVVQVFMAFKDFAAQLAQAGQDAVKRSVSGTPFAPQTPVDQLVNDESEVIEWNADDAVSAADAPRHPARDLTARDQNVDTKNAKAYKRETSGNAALNRVQLKKTEHGTLSVSIGGKPVHDATQHYILLSMAYLLLKGQAQDNCFDNRELRALYNRDSRKVRVSVKRWSSLMNEFEKKWSFKNKGKRGQRYYPNITFDTAGCTRDEVEAFLFQLNPPPRSRQD